VKLEGAHFVVIGATGVLGTAVGAELLARGAKVSAISRSGKTLSPVWGTCHHEQADLRNGDALHRAMLACGSDIDGIVNAAGVVAFGALSDTPSDVVETLMATNAVGTMNVLKVAREVLAEGGVVASFTGVAADMAVLGMSAYCASKAAAKAAMSVAAREFRSRKIRVLDIRAPHTETGLSTRALFGDAPKFPVGLNPADVARRVVTAIETDESDLPATAFTDQ
jgi:cyclic-di-GMP-binding biofilm dispersal mediator protein